MYAIKFYFASGLGSLIIMTLLGGATFDEHVEFMPQTLYLLILEVLVYVASTLIQKNC